MLQTSKGFAIFGMVDVHCTALELYRLFDNSHVIWPKWQASRVMNRCCSHRSLYIATAFGMNVFRVLITLPTKQGNKESLVFDRYGAKCLDRWEAFPRPRDCVL